MRAVNLIPPEDRLVPGYGAGLRSGGLSVALLWMLLVCLVVAVGWTFGARANADHRADVARVTAQADAADAEAAELQRFVDFASQRQQREQTVQQLAANRFDWSRVLRELARVSSGDLVLTGMQATATPDAPSSGGGGDTGALRSALPVPALELTGCAASQDAVAQILRSLRTMEGATQVTLKGTERDAAQAGGTGGGSTQSAGSGGDDCRHGSAQRATFGAVVFFDPAAGLITAGRPSAAAVQESGR